MSGSADGNASDTDSDGNASDPDEPAEFDTTGVKASDIGPIGAMIAVAFTGAVIGLVGAGISLFVSELGLALIGVGVVVALSSPIAYVRHRRQYGS